MAGKVYVLTWAAFCAVALADDDYHGRAGHGKTPAGVPQGGTYHQQKHLPQQGYQQQQHQRGLRADGPQYQHAGGRSGSQEYHGQSSMPVNYQFAYTVQAEGGPAGYGSGSQERSAGGGSAAEFGHTEGFKDGRTEGKYFVGLPDGRLQTVVYHVEGDSGFVADVQYEGGDQSGEQYGRQGGYRKDDSGRQAAYQQGSSGYSSAHQGVSSSRKEAFTPVQKYGGALRSAGDSAEHGQGAAGGGGYATSTHQGGYSASTGQQRYSRPRQY